MRKILLTMLAVILSFTLSYAESCSSGQGSLSYQISGCSEQSRACCSGTWCSWGTSSCASCTATTQACSGNVTNACAGTRTRSVTGSCGSTCTYSGWNDSGCSYTQSCTATSESRNCSGNVTNACAGTQTRTRTVAGTCGSCSYNSWGSWSTNNCSYTQSCTATSESRNCSGNVTNACAGTQTRTRTVAGTCGSCSYNSWGSWTGNCTYTQSCTATTQACSGNVSGACAGNRTRSVTGTCGSCSYSGWSDSGCSYTQSCTATSESRNCSGNVSGACAGTQSRSRSVTGTCGSCSYGSWGSWTGSCTYTQSCTATTQACSGNVSGACAGNRTRTVTGTCGSCSYSGWSNTGCSYTQSCTATSESRNCSGNVSGACAGTQSRSRSVTGTCGSCSYGSWSGWSGSCTYTQSCTDTSKTETETRNCSGNVSGACAGTQSRSRTCTRSVSNSCGSCSYGSWSCGSWSAWSGSCTYTQSCTATSAACSSIGSYTSGTATRTVTGSCGSCTYSAWNTSSCAQCSSSQCWNGSSCASPEATSRNCSGNVSGACAGTQTRTKTCTSGSGWSYGAWTGTCSVPQTCNESLSKNLTCNSSIGAYTSNPTSTTLRRHLVDNCGTCWYSAWTTTRGCRCLSGKTWVSALGKCTTCPDVYEEQNCSGVVANACGGKRNRVRPLVSESPCSYGSYGDWDNSSCYYPQSNCTDTTKDCDDLLDDRPCGTATRTVTDNCGSCSYSSWNTNSCQAKVVSRIYSTTGGWTRIFSNGTNGYSNELGQPYVSYNGSTQPITFTSLSACKAALPSIRQKVNEVGVLTIDCSSLSDYDCRNDPSLKKLCLDNDRCKAYMDGYVVEFVMRWCVTEMICP